MNQTAKMISAINYLSDYNDSDYQLGKFVSCKTPCAVLFSTRPFCSMENEIDLMPRVVSLSAGKYELHNDIICHLLLWIGENYPGWNALKQKVSEEIILKYVR